MLFRSAYDPASPLLATSLTIGLAHPKDRLRTFVRGAATDIGVQVFGTMIPTPDIGVSVDPGPAEQAVSERPQIRLHYDQAALDNLASAPERLRELFGAVGTTVSIPGPFHDVVPGNSVHYGGTVRMHASPEFGALDGWNQMYEVANVVVCDSSCFTTGAEKNPTLTAMAISARAADHLADELARTESRF